MSLEQPTWTVETVLADLKKWIHGVRAEDTVDGLTIFRHLVAEAAPTPTGYRRDVVNAVKARLAEVLPARTSDKQLLAMRELVRLGDRPTSTLKHRRADAGRYVGRSDDADEDHRADSVRKQERRLLTRLAERLTGDEPIERMDGELHASAGDPGIPVDDVECGSRSAGDTSDDVPAVATHTPIIDYLARTEPAADPSGEGVVGIRLELELALGRTLVDLNAEVAPEITGPPLRRRILDFVEPGAGLTSSRLLLIESEGGGGKTTLLQALDWTLHRAAASALAATGAALIPVRLELPLPRVAPSQNATEAAIDAVLGSDAFTHLVRSGGPGGPRLALLIDGADQDEHWTAVAHEIERLLDNDWVGICVVTGRPGATHELSRVARVARQQPRGGKESFGAERLRVAPMNFRETATLARSFASQSDLEGRDESRFVVGVLRALSHFDRTFTWWLDDADDDPEGSLVRYDRDMNDPFLAGLLRADPSITPLLTLLACLVVRDGAATARSIDSEAELLVEVLERWRLREAQRFEQKHELFRSPGAVLAATLDLVVGKMARQFLDSGGHPLPLEVVEAILQELGPAKGVDPVSIPLWLEQLRTCGLLVTRHGNDDWEFVHRRFADVACARWLLLRRRDRGKHALDLWSKVRLGANYRISPFELDADPDAAHSRPPFDSVGALFSDEEKEDDVEPRDSAEPLLQPRAQRWADVFAVFLKLWSREQPDAPGRLLTTIVDEEQARQDSDAEQSDRLMSALMRLAIETGTTGVEPLLDFARTRLQPQTVHQDLEEVTSWLTEAPDRATYERLLNDARAQTSAKAGSTSDDAALLVDWAFDYDYFVADVHSVRRAEILRALYARRERSMTMRASELADELLIGPTPAQAVRRGRRFRHPYDFDPLPWSGRLLAREACVDESPYVIAGALSGLSTVDVDPKAIPALLDVGGAWNAIVREWIEHVVDREDELPSLALQLSDCDAHANVIRDCPGASRWMFGCMLPPLYMHPRGSSFWRSNRPALRDLRAELQTTLGWFGLQVSDLRALSTAAGDSLDIDRRPDASDATRIAARATRSIGGSVNTERCLNGVVGDPRLPWVTRVWAARVLKSQVDDALIVEALATGALAEPPPGELPHIERYHGLVASRRPRPARIVGDPVALRRYTLTAQTAREELMGELGLGTSVEARVAAACTRLILASQQSAPGAIRSAVNAVKALWKKNLHPPTSATDAPFRAVVLAALNAPEVIERCLNRSIIDQFESKFVDPGDAWPLRARFHWSERASRSPWDHWLTTDG